MSKEKIFDWANRPVNGDDLRFVAKELGRSWLDLGRVLHVPEWQLENILVSCSNMGCAEMAFQMLLFWRQMTEGKQPHLQDLINALVSAQRNDIVAEIVNTPSMRAPQQEPSCSGSCTALATKAAVDRQGMWQGNELEFQNKCSRSGKICCKCSRTIGEDGQCLWCVQNAQYEDSLTVDRRRMSKNSQSDAGVSSYPELKSYSNEDIDSVRNWHRSLIPEEPKDGDLIELKFKTVRQTNVRKFAKNSSVDHVIHFVGSFEDFTGAFKLCAPGIILESETATGTLTELGIVQNYTFNVEWQGSMDFKTKSEQFREQKLETITVNVARADIVNEVLKLYSENSIIFTQKLNVKFKGERGVDDEGLTRDLFCSFWTEAKMKYFEGESEWIPFVNPSGCGTLYTTLGNILGHGLLLAQFFPLYFAKACVSLLVGVQPTEDSVFKTFMNFVSVAEQKVIYAALDSPETLTEPKKKQLMRIFSRLGSRENPIYEREALRKQIMDFATSEVLLKPKAIIDEMARGFKIALGSCVDHSSLLQHIAAMTPSTNKVLELLPDGGELVDDEETAFDYLKDFIEGSSDDILCKFLRFTTGCDTITDKIYVEFNTLSGTERRITSNVCGRVIHLPTTFRNFVEFKECFMKILTDPYIWNFDSV